MISPRDCRHLPIIPFKDPLGDVTCPDCGRRYFCDDGETLVWSDPGDPGYDLPHRQPEIPETDVRMSPYGMAITVDPLMPAGTLLIKGLHGAKYFDLDSGKELTREEYMALPCGFEGWKFDPDERMPFTIKRPKDL